MVIEANIVLAGLANSIQNAMATSDFAHITHDHLTHQPELHHWLHGEKVGLRLLIQSWIEEQGKQVEPERLVLLRRFHSPLMLPAAIDAFSVRQTTQQIPFPDASLAHLPFTIDHHQLELALLAAAFKPLMRPARRTDVVD